MAPLFRRTSTPPLFHLNQSVLTVRTLDLLKRAMGWSVDPVLFGDNLNTFDKLEDLNDRKIRDAEVIGAACSNGAPKILLEIGTAYGRTTALMAKNAVDGTVYTVNIPPEEIKEGGTNVTCALEVAQIGKFYRDHDCMNVKQILANTLKWEPDFGPIDVAFIDGCHDADFVYNDTRKVLKKCKPGSIILWHDFEPSLVNVYHWIHDVCLGVDRLIRDGYLVGKILHLQDSWVGLYKVP